MYAHVKARRSECERENVGGGKESVLVAHPSVAFQNPSLLV